MGSTTCPRATEHIADIIEITQGLIDKGFAYRVGGRRLLRRDPRPGVWQAEPSRPGRTPGGGADRALVAQAAPRRLRPLEELEARRAVVGEPVGTGPARLAHRVLGDEHEASGSPLRHPRRRARPGLPPPRERGRPVRVVQRRAVRHLLDAQRPAHQGWEEDLQVGPRHDRPDERPAPGPRPRHAPSPAPDQPLPPSDRLRAVAARRAGARPSDLPQGLRAVRGPDAAPRSTSSKHRPGGPSSIPARSPLLQEIAEHRRRFLEAMDDDFNTGGAIGELFEWSTP